MSMELVNVNIGLLGCGTVGASLCKLIDEQSDAIAERTGLKLAVVMVAVRDVSQSGASNTHFLFVIFYRMLYSSRMRRM